MKRNGKSVGWKQFSAKEKYVSGEKIHNLHFVNQVRGICVFKYKQITSKNPKDYIVNSIVWSKGDDRSGRKYTYRSFSITCSGISIGTGKEID